MLVGECSRVEYQQAMAAFFRAGFTSTPHLCGWNVDRVRGLVVFWHTVGSWNNRPVAGPACGFGDGSCFFWFPAHGLSRSSRTSFRGCSCGGGCDGVVVWELYSGREHLVKQVRKRPVAPWGSLVSFVLFCISNFL